MVTEVVKQQQYVTLDFNFSFIFQPHITNITIKMHFYEMGLH